jgi:putative flippase GtrA
VPRRRRIAPFVVVGIAGFTLQLGAVALLSHAGLAPMAATALGVELAILHNFLWHERWTWRDRPAAAWTERVVRLVRFNASTGLTSIAGNVGLTLLLVAWWRLPLLVANVLAVVALSALNFSLSDRWVFDQAGVADAAK